MDKRPPLCVVLFDLDGTIADTHGLILKCYDHATRCHLGEPGMREIWEAQIGLPLDNILCATFAHYGHARPTTAQLDAMKQTYRDHMRANDSSIRAFDGIPDTLTGLKARGFRLGIVTTKHQAMALRHLRKLGLLGLFEESAVVCGDMCPACKPAPDPFLFALKALGASPEHAAMVGDSRQDVLGAKAAGVLAIAACWGSDNREDLLASGPHLVAQTPWHLPELLGPAASPYLAPK